MVNVVLSVESDPRFWLSPYSTCESDGKSVVQAIVTPVAETDAVSTPEITTCAERFVLPMEAVVKVLSGLTVVLPISSAVRMR